MKRKDIEFEGLTYTQNDRRIHSRRLKSQQKNNNDKTVFYGYMYTYMKSI